MIVRLASNRFVIEGSNVFACDDCAAGLNAAGEVGFKIERRRSCDVCPVRRAALAELAAKAKPRVVNLARAVDAAAKGSPLLDFDPKRRPSKRQPVRKGVRHA
jgi:hypothetical protein